MKARTRNIAIGAGVGIGVYAISEAISGVGGQTAVRVAPVLAAVVRGLLKPKKAADTTNQILGTSSIAALGIWLVRDVAMGAGGRPALLGGVPATRPAPTSQPPILPVPPEGTVPIGAGGGLPAWEQQALLAEQAYATARWAADNPIDARVYPSMYHAVSRFLFDLHYVPGIIANDARGLTTFPVEIRTGLRRLQRERSLVETGYINPDTYLTLKLLAIPPESRV
jgi:hypothetical protein